MVRMITILLALALLGGCASSLLPVTESLRSSTDISTAALHVSSTVTLRSLRVLETVDTSDPFHPDSHRNLVVAESDTGRVTAEGPGWLLIDFGQGIALRFERTARGEYRMPGWGTVTVKGERYDLQVGMLSGKDIRLLVEPRQP
jgi:hypothetical protein